MHKEIAKQIEDLVDIHDKLNLGLKLSEEECHFLNEHFERVEINKNQFIIEEDKKEKYLYFIEEGLFRYWTYNLKLREITFWFSFSGEFANSYFSLKNEKPSAFNIQAIGNSVVWRMKSDDLLNIYTNSLNINKISRIVLEDIFTRKIQREISLLKLTAYFGDTHPAISVISTQCFDYSMALGCKFIISFLNSHLLNQNDVMNVQFCPIPHLQ